MSQVYVISDEKKRNLMDELFETVVIRPKVSKMLMFDQIMKSVKRRSMYRIGKHPNSHMRRGGGAFRSTDLMVDAHSNDAPLSIRRAALAFKKGGSEAAGKELDKRALPDKEHQKLMTELLNTKQKETGKTLSEALADAALIPSTHHNLSDPKRHARRNKTIKEVQAKELAKMKKWGVPIKFDREAHLVIGLPGAGKSTLSDVIQRQKGAVLIDADVIKEKLDGFNDGLGASVVHEESSMVTKVLKDRTVNKGTNFVMPVVGSNPKKIRKCIADLKKRGYKVTMHHVDVPVKFAEQRVVERYLHKKRAVPVSAVTDAGTGTRKSFDELRTVVDGWAAYSAHNIPGRKIRYAVLGTKGYKLPKAKNRNRE